jgi:hypothetical protein
MIINQDTILKLVFRQGSDNDRRKVIFTTGEPVYSTNTRRLYVGNGSLSGGDVVGNRFLGHTTTLATLATNSYAVEGDLGFVLDTNKLYALSGSNGATIGNWKNIGGVYSAGDAYINISGDNRLSLNPLSANSLSVDLTRSPIYLNNGRIGLSPLSAYHVSSDLVTGPLVINNGRIGLPPLSAYHVSSDLVTGPLVINNGRIGLPPLSAHHVSTDLVQLPISLNSGRIGLSPLSANHVSSDLLVAPLILTSGRIGLSSTIPHQSVSTKTILVSSGLVSTANGINSTGIAVNPLSSNIVIQSNQLYAKFNGSLQSLAVSAEYSRNITTATRLGQGHYKFTYGPLPTNNLIPMVQLFGPLPAIPGDNVTRSSITSLSFSACEVNIFGESSISYDSDMAILITY